MEQYIISSTMYNVSTYVYNANKCMKELEAYVMLNTLDSIQASVTHLVVDQYQNSIKVIVNRCKQ